MGTAPHDSSEDRYDAYLDALLRGEERAPEEYFAKGESGPGGADDGAPAWARELWQLARGGPVPAPPAPDLQLADAPLRHGLPRERIGPFRLLRPIGEGGMGRVFLARQEPLGRLCAVKLLRADLADSATAAARLAREGRVLAGLRHDGLVRVLDAGELDGAPWVALELVPGENLDERLARERPAVNEVVRWGAELADGLAHAHAAGVIHRDVKPSNVRITPDGRAMLMDFGLARETTRESLRLTFAFAGTPSYCAPEQVQGRAVDARADVYSLGATLYEALAGAPPFDGDDVERVLDSVVHEAPRPLAALGARVPVDVETIVAKALEKEPGRRYASAAALRDDLRSVLELRPIRARPKGAATRVVDWSRRRPGLVAAAGTALLALVALVGRDLWRAHTERAARRAEATALVSDAARVVARYGRDRDVYERAHYDLRAVASLTQHRHVGPDELARLAAARAVVADYEALRVSLEDVPVLLGRAERLDVAVSGAREAWAEYWYQRWMDVRDEPDPTLATHYRAKVHEVDPDGRWAALVSGRVALTLRSDPPGAAVHLYRLVRHAEAAGERLVPRALDGALGGLAAGEHALEVERDSGELRAGECITAVAGAPVRGAVLRRRSSVPSRGGVDRLVAVAGSEVVDRWDAARRVAALSSASPSALTWASGVPSDDAGELDPATWRTPSELVAEGGVDVTVLREGAYVGLHLARGATTHETGIPIPAVPCALVGVTPLEFAASDPGNYIATFQLDGHEPARVSFHLDHACEHYSRGLTLRARLLPVGTTPPGFVRIDLAARGDAIPPFWIQRYEVTAREYLEFLRSPEGRQDLAAGRVAHPRALATDGAPWPEGEGGWLELPSGVEHDWPMLGITRRDAERYAAWFAARHGLADLALEVGIPSLSEWRWAAYGGDTRAYVFGPLHVASWVSSRYAREREGPASVYAFPLDESPWGVRGLGGGAAEWVDDLTSRAPGALHALCGGAWHLAAAHDFAIARTRYASPESTDEGAGFRLVLREVAR